MKKDQDNRKYILEALQSLKDKGVVIFNSTDIKKEKCLEFSFMRFEKGYEKIPHSYFEMTNEPEEYMILCYVKKIHRSIAYEEFAHVLSCSVSHVKSLILKMETSGLLNVQHGKYIVNDQGDIRRDKNSYRVNQHYTNVNEYQQETNLDEQANKETREHDWYDTSALISVEDYIVFLTTQNEQLKRHAQKRIDRIMNSTGKASFEKVVKQAERAVSQQEYEDKEQQEQEQLMQMSGTPVLLKSGQLLEVTAENVESINFWREVDRIYYVGERDFVGSLKETYMQSFSIRSDLFGDFRRYSDSTENQVIDKLKSLISSGKLDKEGYFSVSHFLRTIEDKLSQGRNYDEDWEGDEWIYFPTGDGGDAENLSKQKRIDEKKYQEWSKQQSNEDDLPADILTTLLDDYDK